MPRRTADQIALIFAATVAIVVVATALASIYVVVADPTQSVVNILDAIGKIIGVLIGALVGYMAGRRMNGENGK